MNGCQPKTTVSYGYDMTYPWFHDPGSPMFGYGTTASPLTAFNLEVTPGNTAAFRKFTGKERDSESGLDYFGARYYGSALGRFTSPDWSTKQEPVPYSKLDNPQTLNLYSYVQNNPLSNFDDDGHATIEVKYNPLLLVAITHSSSSLTATERKPYFEQAHQFLRVLDGSLLRPEDLLRNLLRQPHRNQILRTRQALAQGRPLREIHTVSSFLNKKVQPIPTGIICQLLAGP